MIYEFRDSTCENNSYYTYSIWYKESWEGNAYFVYLKNDFMHPEIPEFILLYKKMSTEKVHPKCQFHLLKITKIIEYIHFSQHTLLMSYKTLTLIGD